MTFDKLLEKTKEVAQFEFSGVIRELWNRLLSREKDGSNVHFDLENNERVGQYRTIDTGVPKSIGEGTIKVMAEMYEASGDWENGIRYFKCQVMESPEPKFIIIPTLDEGNANLVEQEGGWFATQPSGDVRQERKDPSDRKLWAALKARATERVQEYYRDYGDWGKIDEGELKNRLRMWTDGELMG